MSIPFETVVLTDGTEANRLELTDLSRFILTSYDLQVAPRQADALGNSFYAAVEESMTLDIIGSCADECYEARRKLVTLLDQAVAWQQDTYNVSSVVLQVSPYGTLKTTPYEVPIIGVPGGIDYTEAPEFVPDQDYWAIRDVGVTIRRPGLWVNETETAGGTASVSHQNGMQAVHNWALPKNAQIPNPITYTVTVDGTATTTIPAHFFIAWAGQGFRLLACAGNFVNDVPVPGIYANQFDSANLPTSLNNVLRCTPSSTAQFESPHTSGAVGTTFQIAGPMYVFAKVRPSSTARQWTLGLRAMTAGFSSHRGTIDTPPYLFIPTSTNPAIVFLGVLATPSTEFSRFALLTQVDSITGAPFLDWDSVALVNATTGRAVVLGIDALTLANSASANYQVDAAYTTKPRGRVNGLVPVGYRGDPRVMLTSYDDVNDFTLPYTSVALYGTSGNFWRLVNNANAILNQTIAATRRHSYLVPE